MDLDEENKNIQNVVENAMPIDHYEILLTKFLDHSGDQNNNNLNLTLDKVNYYIIRIFLISIFMRKNN